MSVKLALLSTIFEKRLNCALLCEVDGISLQIVPTKKRRVRFLNLALGSNSGDGQVDRAFKHSRIHKSDSSSIPAKGNVFSKVCGCFLEAHFQVYQCKVVSG